MTNITIEDRRIEFSSADGAFTLSVPVSFLQRVSQGSFELLSDADIQVLHTMLTEMYRFADEAIE